MTSIKELENQLSEAGTKLVSNPPSSSEELLQLLDQVETWLLKVDQSPSESTQAALSPLLKALVADQLLRHSNDDVRVAVSACLSEITRITAPEAPYNDDQMREVFKLIVSSFENLSDNSSQSYGKRMSILDTVAKVRSCVVMLDLECDALILEMFQHFLRSIRDYHQENVFQSMETIMTLVLDESEDISPELLSPLLETVKKDNNEVLPIARKLADKVLESSAAKIKTWLVQAVKSLGISVDDYSVVVASICQVSPDASDRNDIHCGGEQLVCGEEGKVMAPSEMVDHSAERPSKPVVSNGIAQSGEKDLSRDAGFLKNRDQGSETLNVSSKGEPERIESVEIEDKSMLGETTRASGRKPTLSEIADVSHVDNEKNVEKEFDNESQDKETSRKPGIVNSSVKEVPREPDGNKNLDKHKKAVVSLNNGRGNGDPSSLNNEEAEEEVLISSIKETEKEDRSSADKEQDEEKNINSSDSERTLDDKLASETVVLTENENENTAQSSSPKELEDQNAEDEMLYSNSEKTSKRAVHSKKRRNLKVAAMPANDEGRRKVSEATNDLGKRPRRLTSKMTTGGDPGISKYPAKTDVSNEEKKGDAGLKQKQWGKMRNTSKSPAKEDGKKRDLEKVEDDKKNVSEDERSSSEKDNYQEMRSTSKSSKKSSKDDRKLKKTPIAYSKGKRKASDVKKYGENLVGARIKVFWPEDVEYYPGKVESFDTSKKQHRVFYDDGEVEVLDLSDEIWEFITDSESVEDRATGLITPDVSSGRTQKKKVKSSHGGDQVKMGASSGNKSKGAIAKSGTKSRDISSSSGKMKGNAVSKSDDRNGRSKDYRNGGKAVDVASKKHKKFEDDLIDTPKTSKLKNANLVTPKTSKAKQDSPRTTAKPNDPSPKSKGKRPRSNGKFDTDEATLFMSGLSKSEEREISDPAESPEIVKAKSRLSSNAHSSKSKLGRKRWRATKS